MNERLLHWWTRFQHHHPHSPQWLFIAFASFCGMSYFLTTVHPNGGVTIGVFIFFVSVFLFSILSLCLNNVRRVSLITGGVGAILFLRAFSLFDPITVLLLVVFLISLELALKNR